MDENQNTDPFDILEDKVGTLISHVSTMKNENSTLKEQLEYHEMTISDLNEETSSLKQSRDEVRNRINALFTRIDELDL